MICITEDFWDQEKTIREGKHNLEFNTLWKESLKKSSSVNVHQILHILMDENTNVSTDKHFQDWWEHVLLLLSMTCLVGFVLSLLKSSLFSASRFNVKVLFTSTVNIYSTLQSVDCLFPSTPDDLNFINMYFQGPLKKALQRNFINDSFCFTSQAHNWAHISSSLSWFDMHQLIIPLRVSMMSHSKKS